MQKKEVTMKLAALISGGKDSIFALYRAVKQGHEVPYLLTIAPESRESYMFHYPNVGITELQSEALGIPLLREETVGEKEEELKDLSKLLSRIAGEVDGIVTGATASSYQRGRIEALCRDFNLEVFNPLWQVDPLEYWEELLENHFEVMISSVACEGLGKEWLGRVIDRESLGELRRLASRHRFHLAFEGGEAETLVLDMPLFRKKIVVEEASREWYGDHGYYLVSRATLREK